jgi:hypothetical protein
MKHELYQVESFEHVDRYTLRVSFNDQSQQVINFEPILRGAMYGPLLDLNLFKQVQLDPVAHTLVWPNGADFDPLTLHNWPQEKAAWLARAHQWESTAIGSV